MELTDKTANDVPPASILGWLFMADILIKSLLAVMAETPVIFGAMGEARWGKPLNCLTSRGVPRIASR